nr:N-acetylmuramoyl-L-alanine amidase [uncultured Pseudodesulfovibrio sp.]
MAVDVERIRQWHTDPPPKGRGWSDIGYHFVILRDGTVQRGRPLWRKGAHVRGHNQFSIGICLVGGRGKRGPEFNFTPNQARSLRNLVHSLLAEFGDSLSICGHRDYNPAKACPCFDVRRWWRTGRWEG